MKVFSDLLKTHIPIYLSVLFSASRIKWNGTAREGLAPSPAANVPGLYPGRAIMTRL